MAVRAEVRDAVVKAVHELVIEGRNTGKPSETSEIEAKL
jgi:hypothetical protein